MWVESIVCNISVVFSVVFGDTVYYFHFRSQSKPVRSQGRVSWFWGLLQQVLSTFLEAECPSYHPTNSVKAAKEQTKKEIQGGGTS